MKNKTASILDTLLAPFKNKPESAVQSAPTTSASPQEASMFGQLFLPFGALTPKQTFVGGAALGAGTFSAMRLISDSLRNLKRKEEAKKRTIQLDLPLPQIENIEKVSSGPLNLIPNSEEMKKFLYGVGGFGGGLIGTKALYDMYKRKQLEKETEEANNEYTTTLKNFNTKRASIKTPILDIVCEGISALLEKDAGSIGFGTGMVGLAGAAGMGYNYLKQQKHPELVAAQTADETHFENTTNGYTKDVKNVFNAVAGAVMLGVAARMYQTKRKRDAKATMGEYPTNVEINYK